MEVTIIRKVKLSMNEQKKYEIIKSLADHPAANKQRAWLYRTSYQSYAERLQVYFISLQNPVATRVPAIWWFYNFSLLSIVFYGGRYSVGTINFKEKAARVPLKENFGRNFFVKKFFKLRKTVKKANVLKAMLYGL